MVLPIRVLTVLLAPQWGGLQGMIEATTPHLPSAGVTRIVALPITSAETRARLENAGASVVDCEFSRLRKTLNLLVHLRYAIRFGADVGRIRDIIRRESIDVVEVAGLFVFQAAIAAKFERRKIVWQLHSDIGPKWARALIGRIVAKTADVVMTSGSGLIFNHGGLKSISHKIVPISSPVDRFRFRPDTEARRRVREHYQFDDDDVVVGTLGNRTWQKSHELLVEAASALGPEHRNIRFLIVGAEVPTNAHYYRREVEEFAQRVNAECPGRVVVDTQHFPASDIMNAIDVFSLTSVAEGASLVTAEAMATGKPAVTVDVGSLSDLVIPGATGYLLPRNAKYFAEAFVSLSEPILRSELGRNARNHVVRPKESPAEAHIRAYRRCVWPAEEETHYYAFISIDERSGATESKLFRSMGEVKSYARSFLADPSNDPPMTPQELDRLELDLSKISPRSGVAIHPCDAWRMAVIVAPIIDTPKVAEFAKRGEFPAA